jgi:alpha-L-fucosidase 2
MMLQSWDGALRIFPAWPRDQDARFESFRAEGALLVSAAWSKGKVVSLQVFSEKGSACRLYVPWNEGMKVTDSAGQPVTVTPQLDGRAQFATRAGASYRLQPGN